MTAQARSQCSVCAHFRSPFSVEPYREGPFCAAFEAGISDAVYTNHLDHRQPVEGDHGVRWAPLPGAEYPDND
jgi:hypothetical protein